MEVEPRYLRPADDVLDVGTGGGEKLLAFSRHFGRGVGIDPDPEMAWAARENGAGQTKVTFAEMAAEDLEFPEASFDVVLTRHAPVAVPEVVRVLKPGGYFVTQGIGDQNMANVSAEFGTVGTAHYDAEYRSQVDGFVSHGCEVVATGAYTVRYWVKDVPSLIFWFKALASGNEIPAGFSIDRNGAVVRRIIDTYSTPNGVLTTEHRTLLVVRKRQWHPGLEPPRCMPSPGRTDQGCFLAVNTNRAGQHLLALSYATYAGPDTCLGLSPSPADDSSPAAHRTLCNSWFKKARRVAGLVLEWTG